MAISTDQRPAVKAAPKQPLRSYTALATTFNVGLVAGILALKHAHKLPERPRVEDVVLLGVSTFELSRIITRGKITSFLRRPFARYEGPADVPSEEEDEPIGHGPRRAIGELLTCPYCLSTWIAAGFTLGLAVAPRQVRMVGTVFAVKAVSDALNTVYAQAWDHGDQEAHEH
jgi:hypothetical protein